MAFFRYEEWSRRKKKNPMKGKIIFCYQQVPAIFEPIFHRFSFYFGAFSHSIAYNGNKQMQNAHDHGVIKFHNQRR